MSIALGVWILQLNNAPADLIRAVLSSVAGVVAVLVVNLFWKLSAHSAVAAFFSLTALILYGVAHRAGWYRWSGELVPGFR